VYRHRPDCEDMGDSITRQDRPGTRLDDHGIVVLSTQCDELDLRVAACL
jgi:hypothetical protein